MGIGIVEAYILYVIIVVGVFGTIVRRAGFSRWLSLLLVVPLLNIVMVWVFAFAKWPAIAESAPESTR